MVDSGPGTSGTRHIARDYPNTSGLTAGTTKQEGRKPHLEPQGIDGVKDTSGDKTGME